MPSITPVEPLYPFQHICADFFHHQGVTYLVLVDRFSNWPVITTSRDGATGLTQMLRDTFSTFGIPDKLTSDGGPEFASHTTRAFLANWGVHHRISSAYHPHANCRAEVVVKTMKRLIAGNTGPGGTLSDKFHKALLQYRNGPDPETKMFPATCLFGRPTRDLLPGIPDRYRSHTDWSDRLDLRERALSKRAVTGRTRWDKHAQGLSPLKCGDTVLVQNQTGRYTNKWDKTRHGCRSPPIPSVLCSHRRLRQTHHQKPQIPPTIHPAPDGTHVPPAILPPTRCPDHTRATAYPHPPRHEATPTRSTARTYSPHAPTRACDHPGNRPSTTGYAGSDHPRRSTWKHPQIIRLCRPDADQITRPPYQDLASKHVLICV